MKLGEVYDAALQIADAYSENGYVISDEHPEKADYLLRMNAFLNQAMLRIITVYPVMKVLELEGGVDFGGEIGYKLPRDYAGEILIRRYRETQWGAGEFTAAGEWLLVPFKENPTIFYHAVPRYIGISEGEDVELEIAEAGARLAPIFIAAMLLDEENPTLSTRLMNQFEATLAQGDKGLRYGGK